MSPTSPAATTATASLATANNGNASPFDGRLTSTIKKSEDHWAKKQLARIFQTGQYAKKKKKMTKELATKKTLGKW